MKRSHRISRTAGFTLIEVCMSIAVLMVVGMIAYSVGMNSTTLMAKNMSLNETNLSARTAMDRIYAEVNQANGLPKLIDADGNVVPGNGPAAGIIFDRFLGGPYVVTNPGNGLKASAKTFQMKRSTETLASPPIPRAGDVVRIGTGTMRPVVSSCSAGSIAGNTQNLTVTLQAALGTDIDWSEETQQTAYLLHREAFLIVPSNGRAELRLYKNAEAVSDYGDSSAYVVLNREISARSDDETKPFSIATQNGQQFIKIAMRIENQNFNRSLASRQKQEFNTFLRVDTMIRPRNFF